MKLLEHNRISWNHEVKIENQMYQQPLKAWRRTKLLLVDFPQGGELL